MTTETDHDANAAGPRFREHMGFETVELDAEHAVIEIDIEDRHRSPRGLLHGGALLAIADVAGTALAIRSNSVEAGGDGRPLAVVDVHAVIVGNQDAGRVRAEARLVRRGRRVTVVRIAVTGAEGRLLAEMTTTNVPV